jgi:hypothetical protein
LTGKFLSLTVKAGTVIGGQKMSLVRDLTPLVLGVLLTWTGATTLLDRSASQQTAAHALAQRLLGNGHAQAMTTLRVVGWAELLVGLGLLGIPTHRLPAVGAAALGLGYAGILVYTRWRPAEAEGETLDVPPTTPEETATPGGVAGRGAEVRWQSYVRAGLVITGGLLASTGAAPWWMAGGRQPVAAFVVVVMVALVLVALSAPADQVWGRKIPLPRVRLPQARRSHLEHRPARRVDSVQAHRVDSVQAPDRAETLQPADDGPPDSGAWTVPIPAADHEGSLGS